MTGSRAECDAIAAKGRAYELPGVILPVEHSSHRGRSLIDARGERRPGVTEWRAAHVVQMHVRGARLSLTPVSAVVALAHGLT